MNINKLLTKLKNKYSADKLEKINSGIEKNANKVNVFVFEILNTNEIKNQFKNRIDYIKYLNTGENSLLLRWVNSETNFWNNKNQEILRQYRVGDYFKARVIDYKNGYEITNNQVYEEFKEINKHAHIDLEIDNYDIAEMYADKIIFFYVPEIDKKAFFYTSNLGQKQYLDNKNKTYAISLSLDQVNNELLQSGKSVDNYFIFNSVGGAYAFPKVINGEVFLDNDKLDENKSAVSEFTFETSNLFCLHSITFFGKDPNNYQTIKNGKVLNVKETLNLEVEKPKILLPYITKEATTQEFFKGIKDNEVCYIPDLEIALEEYYEKWQDYVKNKTMTPEEVLNFEGFLETRPTGTTLEQANNSSILFDKSKLISYNNNGEYVTSSPYYSEQKINLNNKLFTQAEILTHNFFNFIDVNTIKFSKTSKVKIGFNDTPIFGKILDILTLGLKLSVTTDIQQKVGDKIPLFVNKNLLNYGNKTFFKGDSTIRIPLNFLKNSKTEDAGLSNLKLHFSLGFTDLFKENATSDKIWNTNDLLTGKVRWSEECVPVKPQQNKEYVITGAMIKGIGECNFNLMFSNSKNIEQWQGFFKSQSTYIKNIKDWQNVYNFDNLKRYVVNYKNEDIYLERAKNIPNKFEFDKFTITDKIESLPEQGGTLEFEEVLTPEVEKIENNYYQSEWKEWEKLNVGEDKEKILYSEAYDIGKDYDTLVREKYKHVICYTKNKNQIKIPIEKFANGNKAVIDIEPLNYQSDKLIGGDKVLRNYICERLVLTPPRFDNYSTLYTLLVLYKYLRNELRVYVFINGRQLIYQIVQEYKIKMFKNISFAISAYDIDDEFEGHNRLRKQDIDLYGTELKDEVIKPDSYSENGYSTFYEDNFTHRIAVSLFHVEADKAKELGSSKAYFPLDEQEIQKRHEKIEQTCEYTVKDTWIGNLSAFKIIKDISI